MAIVFLITLSLYLVLAVIVIAYTIAKHAVKANSFKDFNNRMSKYFYCSAYGLDQAASPLLKEPFNDWFIKPDGYKAGNPDDTLSYILGVNRKQNTLYFAGKMLAKIVDFIFNLFGDKNHIKNAVNDRNN